jgi:hypothetical protein
MPIRTVNQVCRFDRAESPKVQTLVAATSTVVLPDLYQGTVPNKNTDWGMEIRGRYIFNDTGAALYYALGTDKCDNVSSYHGKIPDQGQFNASDCGDQVSVYSVAGGPISVTIIHSQDMHQPSGILSQNAIQT